MEVVFRADASSTIGHGHVMRCLSLARALGDHGASCMFLSMPAEGDLRDRIARTGIEQFPIADMSASAIAAALGAIALRPDWLVVDHYQLDRAWESQIRRVAGRIMVIDDHPRRPHDCDVLLDQNLSAMAAPLDAGGAQTLTGVDYALLQPEYRQLRAEARPRAGAVRRVLISFGGSDRFGLTAAALRAALAHTGPDVAIDVVLPSAIPDRAAIAAAAAASGRAQLHIDAPTLAPLMLAADLAIGAAGSTSWERLCLGVPSIVAAVGVNQAPIAAALHDLGLAISVGAVHDALTAMPGAIKKVVDAGLDEAWSRRCMTYVDGKGATRVAAVLAVSAATALRARPATVDDELRLLRWANDPVTRRESFTGRPIAPAEHHKWFHRVLGDAAVRQLIIETDRGAEVGQARFQKRDGEWEVHYAVVPEFRGRRLGTPLLRAALDAFGRERPGRVRVIGRVKASNVASRRIFEALDFTRDRDDGSTITYARIQ